MDESKLIGTAQDAKRHGFCISGVKKVAKKHNVDFRSFIKNGITVEELRSLNDPLANQFAQKIIEDHKNNEVA